jgi:RNA polymerase sigma factor (sigma-70 family)
MTKNLAPWRAGLGGVSGLAKVTGRRYHPAVSDAQWEQDQTLLEAWRGGDSSAGEALYERHARSVLRFYRNKLPDLAEELTQQTFLALIEGRDRIREGVTVRAFLMSIARHKLLSHLRRKSRSPISGEEARSIAALVPGASTIFARKREQQLLLEGLRRIPLEHQIALELFYWEGLNAKDTADVFGISHSAMRSRLSKARSLLEAKIAELAESPELSSSTISDLDEWAAGIRKQL